MQLQQLQHRQHTSTGDDGASGTLTREVIKSFFLISQRNYFAWHCSAAGEQIGEYHLQLGRVIIIDNKEVINCGVKEQIMTQQLGIDQTQSSGQTRSLPSARYARDLSASIEREFPFNRARESAASLCSRRWRGLCSVEQQSAALAAFSNGWFTRWCPHTHTRLTFSCCIRSKQLRSEFDYRRQALLGTLKPTSLVACGRIRSYLAVSTLCRILCGMARRLVVSVETSQAQPVSRAFSGRASANFALKKLSNISAI